MADSKITALTALTAADPANDMIPIVDVSDTPPASGNTKRISINNLLACSPSATLASATITGDLTVRTNKLAVTSTGVGIGMTPITPLSGVIGTTGAVFFRTTDPAAAVATPYIQAPVSTGFSSTSPAYGFWYQACGIGNPALNNVSIITDSAERYKIDSTGVSTWSVAGTTAMTLNSTGLNIANGNVILGTSAKGIDFSATSEGSGTMTSELLNDYEEGTFTATVNGSTTNPTTPLTATGRYTKIGRQVTVTIKVGGNTTGGSGRIQIEGLPFANNSSVEAFASVGFDSMATFTGSPFGVVVANGTIIYMQSSISSTTYGQVTFNAGVSQNAWVSLTYSV